MKLLLLSITLCLSGCFHLTAVEHSVYGGITRSHSGGEIYSETPSGSQEQGGSWYTGTMIKTVWTK